MSGSDTGIGEGTAAPARKESRDRRLTILLAAGFVLVCFIWGTTWIAIKLAVTDLPPLTSSGLRFVIAAPVFIAACRYLKIPMRYPRKLTWFSVYIGAGYFAIPFFLYNFGEKYISSGLTAICFSSVSVLMVVFSVPILRSRITPIQFISVLIAFTALGLLIFRSQGIAITNFWGVAAVLLAAAMHALAYVLMKRHTGQLHTLTINTLPMAVAGVLLVVLGLIIEHPGASAFTARSVGATLYLGVVASVIGFAVYFWLVQQMDTVTVSFVFVLFPVVAQFFSVRLEGTAFGTTEFLLMLVILGAFAVTQWGQRHARAKSAAFACESVSAASGTGMTERAIELIYQHAMDVYPMECCGFVRASQVKRCMNAIDEFTRTRPEDFSRSVDTGYAFGIADLKEIAESLDRDDPVLTIYHSHPDVGSYFSDEDHRHAVVDGMPVYPVRHLVVDVTEDGVRGARLFEFSAEQGRYVECATFGQPEDRRPVVTDNLTGAGRGWH